MAHLVGVDHLEYFNVSLPPTHIVFPSTITPLAFRVKRALTPQRLAATCSEIDRNAQGSPRGVATQTLSENDPVR
jgi:hypothetical protein